MDYRKRHDKIIQDLSEALEKSNLGSAKLMKRGGTDGRKRLEMLFDEGSFTEIGAYTKMSTDEKNYDFNSVVTGYGAVDGRLVFAYSQNFSFMSGAFGEAQAKKILSLYAMAEKNSAPVIAIFDSVGANVKEGVGIAASYGALINKAASLKGKITQISLVCGVCGGAAAILANTGDYIVMEKRNGFLFLNPPSVIKSMDGDENYGSADFCAASGRAAMVCEGEEATISYLKRLLNFLPSNSAEGTLYCADCTDLDRAYDYMSGLESTDDIDACGLISGLCDRGDFIELWSDFKNAEAIRVGFMALGGKIAGFAVTDYKSNDGYISSPSLEKATKFVKYCNEFKIPLLTLINTNGFCAGDEICDTSLASKACELAVAYASAGCAKVTAYIGKAYGAAISVLGSKALGADMVFATPWAQIAIMKPDAAISFMWNDRLAKEADPKAGRAKLEEEWSATEGSPLTSAYRGHIDMIIDENELRARLISAFDMLS